MNWNQFQDNYEPQVKGETYTFLKLLFVEVSSIW